MINKDNILKVLSNAKTYNIYYINTKNKHIWKRVETINVDSDKAITDEKEIFLFKKISNKINQSYFI